MEQGEVKPTGAGANPEGEGVVPQRESMIPKYRFDEVNRRAQEAESKIAELQKALDASKDKDARITALEKELADTKSTYELEKTNAKRNSAIDAAVKDKVFDADVIRKLLDMDKITFDDEGNVAGLEEQLKELQTSKPFLWKPAKPIVKPGAPEGKPVDKTFAQKMAEKKKAQLGVTAKSKNYFN